MQSSRLIRYGLMLLIAMNLFIFHTALSQSLADAEIISCNESGCTREESIQVAFTEEALKLLSDWGKERNIEIPPHDEKLRACCLTGSRWKFCHMVTFSKEMHKDFAKWRKGRNISAKGKPAP